MVTEKLTVPLEGNACEFTQRATVVEGKDDQNNDSEDVYEQPPREKGVRGLLILAILESLGIAAIIVYWLVQLG